MDPKREVIRSKRIGIGNEMNIELEIISFALSPTDSV